ncbi:hypothetical protein [uncultured Pantoea sp.]|jgi:hypothetical protein|uniref:hypothetical protein n=1 Tax=uncultured Pantoea sp. TaxID=218084 RepID=UPI0025EE336C|nr:hypothetical protein [uncultured Pantoea sp.]
MVRTQEDQMALERAKGMLYRIAAELSLVTAENKDEQIRLDSARRMAADNALRLEDHLREF